MFWGYAPALDLLRELEKSRKKDSKVKNEAEACTAIGNDGSSTTTDNGGDGTSAFPDDGPNRGVLDRGDTQFIGGETEGEPKPNFEHGKEGSGEVPGGTLAGTSEASSGGGSNTDANSRGSEKIPDDSRGIVWKWRDNSSGSTDFFSGMSDKGIDSSSELLEEDHINILLVGSCDARHIFKTISRLHRHPEHRPVRFFVLDPLMEMVGRQLLLLYAALQPPSSLGHKEKVRLLLEITGNTLVRPVTALWITKAAKRLQKMVTNETFMHQKMPQVRLDQLRYQERDQLEDVFSFWQGRPQNFRIGYHWDERLRRTLKNRYDNRSSIFDWDYYMILKEIPKGDRVCMREYKNWRSSGVAFTWLEAEPSVPNVTLATGIFREGPNLLHHGYLGDLKISPYISYSIEVEPEDEKDMWAKRNNEYAQRSTDVAERHLSRVTYEMIHQEPYVPPADTSTCINGIIITQISDHSHINPEAPPVEEDDDVTRRRRHHQLSEDLDDTASFPVDARVTFVSAKLLRDTPALRRTFNEKVDVAVVASVLAEAHVHSDLFGAIRNGGLLLVEGSKFHLERKAERGERAAKLKEKIKGFGFQLEGNLNICVTEEDYFTFRIRR